MRVIAKGREQKGWTVGAQCTGGGNGGGGCGAQLLVEESDLYQTQSQALHETTYHVTFKCVDCGVETDLHNVPHHIQRKLPSKIEYAERTATSGKS